MNERILQLALINRLMNYVDLETPRHYFVSADIDEEDIQLFAMYCVHDAIRLIEEEMHEDFANYPKWYKTVEKVKNYFRVTG